MKKTLFLLLLVSLAVSSCATARYYGGFTPETARQDMVLLGPTSYQYYLDRDRQESFSDSLSALSETLIAGLVDQLGVPVSGRIDLDNDQKEEAAAYIRLLAAQDPKQRGQYQIPAILDEALEAEGCRYGLLLYAQGMTRDSKGYTKEVTKSALIAVATAVLSLGTMTMYPTADHYASQIFAAVLDAETNQLVFYNMTKPEEKHPLHPDPVRDELRAVLKDFLK
jgi:hypothetical protein